MKRENAGVDIFYTKRKGNVGNFKVGLAYIHLRL
jgi:hypothetical protein